MGRRRVGLVAVCAVTLAVLLGCSDDDDAQTTASTATTALSAGDACEVLASEVRGGPVEPAVPTVAGALAAAVNGVLPRVPLNEAASAVVLLPLSGEGSLVAVESIVTSTPGATLVETLSSDDLVARFGEEFEPYPILASQLGDGPYGTLVYLNGDDAVLATIEQALGEAGLSHSLLTTAEAQELDQTAARVFAGSIGAIEEPLAQLAGDESLVDAASTLTQATPDTFATETEALRASLETILAYASETCRLQTFE